MQDVATDLGVKDVAFLIEIPKEKSHGDLASNVALALFTQIKNQKSKIKNLEFKSPLDLANDLVKKIEKLDDLKQYFDKVEVAPPGFINFYYSKAYLASELKNIINLGSDYGNLELGKGKKA